MLVAKNAGMPVVILDALSRAEERGSFLMDHLPRAPVRCPADGAWSAGDIYRALNILVDECLKRVLWRHQQRLAGPRDDIAWWAPHAPEPATLLNWMINHAEALTRAGPILRVLHPDPPLGRDEKAVLDQIMVIHGGATRLDVMTPRLLAARGG
jgi:hypothetical protein